MTRPLAKQAQPKSCSSASILNDFLTGEARGAVVRLREPEADESATFSGFFVTPNGHLVTALHSVKVHAHKAPIEFPLVIEFDATNRQANQICGATKTVLARCDKGWYDRQADWALLKVDGDYPSYMPLRTAFCPTPDLAAELRVYGFDVTAPGTPSLGLLSGRYLRPIPEKGKFQVEFPIRAVGQSGGPVIYTKTHRVIGSAAAFNERFVGEAALLDQRWLKRILPTIDVQVLEQDWRLRAATYLSENDPALAEHAAEFLPALPQKHVEAREQACVLADAFRKKRYVDVALHGPSGSGKSVLARELVDLLMREEAVTSVFWHDFDLDKNQDVVGVIRRLALHVLRHHGAFEPLEACLADGFLQDNDEAVAALTATVRRRAMVLVFDNIHRPQRSANLGVLSLVEQLTLAARRGNSRMILTSWDRIEPPLDSPIETTSGFSAKEVQRLMGLYNLKVSNRALAWISGMSSDIVCLLHFIRSAEWRADVERGGPTIEPDALREHWSDRFLGGLSSTEARIVLALAVLAEPVDMAALESVSDVCEFAACLEKLRRSPPIIERSSGCYYIHLNVQRAALSLADLRDIRILHRSAALHFRARSDFVRSARHFLCSEDLESACSLLYEHRERVIAMGQVGPLEDLLQDLCRASSGIEEGLHRVHTILASCREVRGNYVDAMRSWRHALEVSPGALAEAQIHNRLADTGRMASDYFLAENEYRLGKHCSRSQSDAAFRREFARSNLGMAKLKRLECFYDDALDLYTAARDVFESLLDEPGMIEAAFGVGEVCRLRWDLSAAHSAYEDSLDRAHRCGDELHESYALWGLGEVERLRGRPALAVEIHSSGLRLCSKVGDTRSEGWALMGIAEAQRALRRVDDSVAGYSGARAKFEFTQSETEGAHALLGLAESYRDAGSVRIELYCQAERVYMTKNLRHCLVVCYLAKAAALRTLTPGDVEADELVRKALQLASVCGLELELTRSLSMTEDPRSAPFLPLTFP